jgi:nitrite reductase (NADH) small subunit
MIVRQAYRIITIRIEVAVTRKFACEVNDLSDNDVKIIEVEGTEIGLFRNADKYFAYRNLCPHQGGPVCDGLRMPRVTAQLRADKTFQRSAFSENEMHFICPWHGWEFKLDTGEAVGDPSFRVVRYQVVEKDGKLYVDI